MPACRNGVGMPFEDAQNPYVQKRNSVVDCAWACLGAADIAGATLSSLLAPI
jgi:hypothetical protein